LTTARSDGSFSIGSGVWPGVSKLVEEVGELGQVLGKLIATHGAAEHWDGTNLRQRLIEEMGDVLAAVDFVGQMNLTPQERILMSYRAETKRRLFFEWQDAQEPTS
jgi:NTP pyrophosphatase (non-canonical NTP hydrolase)